MNKLICFELKFPSRQQMDDERKRWHLEQGIAAGIDETILKTQIDHIGKIVWRHVYDWMKSNTTILYNNDSVPDSSGLDLP